MKSQECRTRTDEFTLNELLELANIPFNETSNVNIRIHNESCGVFPCGPTFVTIHIKTEFPITNLPSCNDGKTPDDVSSK